MHLLLPILAEGEGLQIFDVGQSSMIWTIIIFVLALPLMWKFVFGPITKALNDREAQARESARAAEAAKEEIERMKVAIQEDLDQARREGAQRVAEAKARAETREKEILAAAQAEAEKDRARAREEIDRALASAREQLRSESVSLGVQIAERVLERQFSKDDQARMIQDFQKDFAAG